MSTLTLQHGWTRISELEGRTLGEFVSPQVLSRAQANKGGIGRALESAIGLASHNGLLDFPDGELKSYRADADGFPLESIYLHRFSGDIDRYLRLPRFEDTPLYQKIRSVLLVGVQRDAVDPTDWRIVSGIHVSLAPRSFWFRFVEASYQDVLKQLTEHLVDGGMFHTFSGAYLQVRVKDSRPYSPVFSPLLGREISNKGIGFYFTRRFIVECMEEARACR